ncbi:hypothetical protein ACKWTF_003604 [Chironomus riparius]
MSTFNGQIEEIRHISVDSFEDIACKCYFLSHCHSDHMRGLENLSKISSPLYTTSLSALIIQKKYPSINVQILEYGCPMNIKFMDDEDKEVQFIVTALNATGHCLGACMLLFQLEGLDILYTGDFRISLKHAQNINVLKEIKNYGSLILYLDTTFLSQSYKHFPTQHESSNKVIEIIDKHLSQSSSHRVCLQPSARYGYERLLTDINKKFKERVYIHEEAVYDQYLVISDLSSCITRDVLNSRISLKPSFVNDSNGKAIDKNTLNIKLSAMYWRNWNKNCPFECIDESKKSVRVCYATHNSESELRDFVTFLEPKSIVPTVMPNSFQEKEIMRAMIRSMIKSFKSIVEDPKPKNRFKRLRTINSQKCVEQISKKLKK